MILSTLIIFILFTSTLSATTEKSIKYIEINISPENKTTKQPKPTTATGSPPVIPDKICENFNDETRKYCMGRFKNSVNMFFGFIRDRSNDRKCLYYTDIDLNSLIEPSRWPERFPKTTTTTPKTTPK